MNSMLKRYLTIYKKILLEERKIEKKKTKQDRELEL